MSTSLRPAAPPLRQHAEFFELMRWLESGWPPSSTSPTGGTERRRPMHLLRLPQAARLDMAPAELAPNPTRSDAEGERPLTVALRHFGLFAPYGPLPIFVTELAGADRRAALERFLGLLSGNLAWYDYKAWSALHAVVSLDRSSEGGTFVRQLRTLSNAQASDGTTSARAAHRQRCRTHHPGMYVGPRRTLQGLQDLLADYFSLPVAVLPRTGGWRHTGAHPQKARVLGRWTLGQRIFDPAALATLRIGPVDPKAFTRLRRRGDLLKAILEVADDFARHGIDFRVEVDVRTRRGMNGQLGAMHLGQDTWASPLDAIKRVNVHEPCY